MKIKYFNKEYYCFLFLTAATFIQITAFTSCIADITSMPIKIILSNSSATLSPGESLTLTANVFPDEATNKEVVWSSSDPTIAEVNNGVVTALQEGIASINVSSISGNIAVSCLLTVVYTGPKVVIEKAPRIIATGEQLKLKASISPEGNTPNVTLKWSSSDEVVATVNNEGVVTAISPGKVSISTTATTGEYWPATFDLTVFSGAFCMITINLRSATNSTFTCNGIGSIFIDWGDDTPVASHNIKNQLSEYSHKYTNVNSPYTITILGESTTQFQCYDLKETKNLNIEKIELISRNSLGILKCNHTQLDYLDVSGCTSIIELKCNNNKLTKLDLINNIALQNIDCSYNQLNTQSLNDLFHSLHNNFSNKSINIYGNPGYSSSDNRIARNKGWRFYNHWGFY